MPEAIRWAAQVLPPGGGIRVGQQIQMVGFYLAGFLCLVSAVLKLTIEGHWSWWRVLLPLGVFGDNALYRSTRHEITVLIDGDFGATR